MEDIRGAAARRRPGSSCGPFVHEFAQACASWAAADGYRLVGGIGEYEGAWRMAYVRGPEGIIVSLAERIG